MKKRNEMLMCHLNNNHKVKAVYKYSVILVYPFLIFLLCV